MSAAALSFPVSQRQDPLPVDQREAVLANPGFGKNFTDHMVPADVDGRRRAGTTARSRRTGRSSLDPAAAVLHYAQEIFEGMKAYRHADGSVWTFRPEANAERFARSARRLALPELPERGLRRRRCDALVAVDQAWVPVR